MKTSRAAAVTRFNVRLFAIPALYVSADRMPKNQVSQYVDVYLWPLPNQWSYTLMLVCMACGRDMTTVWEMLSSGASGGHQWFIKILLSFSHWNNITCYWLPLCKCCVGILTFIFYNIVDLGVLTQCTSCTNSSVDTAILSLHIGNAPV